MISLFNARYSTVLLRTGSLVTKIQSCGNLNPPWKSRFLHSGFRTVNSGLLFTRFQVQPYTSKRSGGLSSSSRKKKTDPQAIMKDDKETFFVVRKGDVVGVYKSLSDCQAQAGTSICDRPISIYEGSCMPKDTAKHLTSRGLKNAIYTIKASDFTLDLFGTLVACPLQETPSSSDDMPSKPVTKKKSEKALSYGQSCIVEFDGASKGNPGPAGAGAILRSDDGTVICRLRQGLGKATCNVAEYQALILGMKYALEKGFTVVRVRGDSKLIIMQIQGLWRVKRPHLSVLCYEAKELRDRFTSVQIMHVLRDANSDADAQANLASQLAEGEIQEDIDEQL